MRINEFKQRTSTAALPEVAGDSSMTPRGTLCCRWPVQGKPPFAAGLGACPS